MEANGKMTARDNYRVFIRFGDYKWIIENLGYGPFIVYFALASHDRNNCHPSCKQLMQDTGLSKNGLIYNLKILKAAGVFVCDSSVGRGNSKTYKLKENLRETIGLKQEEREIKVLPGEHNNELKVPPQWYNNEENVPADRYNYEGEKVPMDGYNCKKVPMDGYIKVPMGRYENVPAGGYPKDKDKDKDKSLSISCIDLKKENNNNTFANFGENLRVGSGENVLSKAIEKPCLESGNNGSVSSSSVVQPLLFEDAPNPPVAEIKTNGKKARNKTVIDDDRVEKLYALYPRKVGDKKESVKAIKKALTIKPFEYLHSKLEEYAGSTHVSTSPADKIPYPATWFNGERWNDDPKEWKIDHNKNTPLEIYLPWSDEHKRDKEALDKIMHVYDTKSEPEFVEYARKIFAQQSEKHSCWFETTDNDRDTIKKHPRWEEFNKITIQIKNNPKYKRKEETKPEIAEKLAEVPQD